MITSIVVTGEYSIGIDKNDKFQVGDKKIGLKEVPFVRYRFDEYTESSLSYIKKMKSTFKYSSHMVEITVKPGVKELVDTISESIENLIVFLYVNITDEEVNNGLSEETVKLLEECSDSTFDRVMLKDNSTSLYLVSANRLKKEVSDAMGINPAEIGICQSPLSFNGEACLTAVMARQLSAMYSENDEGALPSANHECMKTCGCIKYIKITGNIYAPIVTSKPSNSKSTNKTTSKTNKGKNCIPRLGG